MKNFEEQYTAWLDGELGETERAEFEAQLPDRNAALSEAAGWGKLRNLMRETILPVPVPHADFLNHQVLEAIRRESPASPERAPVRAWFPLGRLAWTGAFLVILAAVLSVVMLPRNGGVPTGDQFISQVIDARAADPKLGAYAFAAPGGKGAVLWVTDAGYIPANESIK